MRKPKSELKKDGPPLVSIIVPQYNRKEFLPINLASLLSQTYKNIEILVVNDGGEPVEDIVKYFNDPRIRLFNKENGGLSSSRNHGLKFAKGKYIATIDQDDGAYPYFVEHMVNLLENDSHKIAYCDSVRLSQMRDENGVYRIIRRDIPYSIDFSLDLILLQNLTPCNCLMISKDCFDKVPPYDEKVKVYEDWIMNIELAKKYPFVHVPIPLVFHTWREDGSTMSSSRDFTSPLPELFKKNIEFAKNKEWFKENANEILRARGSNPIF